MFRLYHSNQLDLLKSLMAHIIEQQPLTDPFEEEIILVQSQGMAQWLKIQLAEQLGIAANIEFALPARFIWQLFSRLFADVPEESAFSKEAMTWKLMSLLPTMLTDERFSPLSHYLHNDDDLRKHYQLATRLADIFDHYLVYRPNWLQAWEKNEHIPNLAEHQQWQSLLWQALLRETVQLNQPTWHRANLYQRFVQTLASNQLDPSLLPKRIFICGISSMSPMYIHIFQLLGQYQDVHLMFTNPCRYYWGDIQDKKFLSKLQSRKRHRLNQPPVALFRQTSQVTNLFNDIGEQQLSNPLLASWGKQGRDNLFLLAQLEPGQEIDAFVDIPTTTLLQRIQRDILELEDHTVIGEQKETLEYSGHKQLLATDDHSIEFHLCHSAQREVEVLYDRLLALLDENPELYLRDIIVMVADIDQYVPYIQSVFGNAPTERYLPFTISDRRAATTHPLIRTFLSLLDISNSRFNAEDILTLLDTPALAKRFEIDEDNLPLIHKWVSETGIFWGLDEYMQQQLDLTVTGIHTWHFGLSRMLLGYVMNSQSGVWKGILPYDETKGLIASLVGQLAQFLTRLAQWRQQLQMVKTLKEWQPLCHQLLEDFFVNDSETSPLFTLIEQQWQQLISEGIKACYQQAIPIIILRDELSQRLNSEHLNPRFLAGAINFCTLMPMRSIPFKVICLLGMNDNIYPRTVSPLKIDLISQHPQRGDRSRRDDDRYLFLEAILSAQQNLYISYISRSLQDNKQRYPSVLVTELLDYIAQSHVLPGDESLDIDSSSERVISSLQQQHPRVIFSPHNFYTNSAQQSYAKEWLPIAQKRLPSPINFSSSLMAVETSSITLDELQRFYRHPIRAFFQQRLQVRYPLTEQELTEEEPFTLAGLQRYKVNTQILDHLINGNEPQQLFQQLTASGMMPYGAFGELVWIKQLDEIKPIAQRVLMEKQPTEKIEINLQLDGVHLTGWLKHAQSDGVLRWRAAELRIEDAFTLWIEHLIYHALGGKGESRMYGAKKQAWGFKLLTPTASLEILRQLIQGYRQGLSEPLYLLPEIGWKWLQKCQQQQEEQDQQQREQLAKQIWDEYWQNDFYLQNKKTDPYLFRLLELCDEQILQRITTVAESYLLPLMNHQRDEQK